MEKRIEGFRRFRREVFPQHAELFRRLAEGQSPSVLFITCCDSRIDPCLLTAAHPGDMMVVRNAGNIVPPSHMESGEAAAVELCVTGIRVRDIVVCGHSNCSAIKCLLWPEKAADMRRVGPWVHYAEPARRRVQPLHPNMGHDELLIRTAQENVVEQLEHLRSFPCVAEAMAEGRLNLHGWYYDIASGGVAAWNPKTREFETLA